jgi:hypothetical protein
MKKQKIKLWNILVENSKRPRQTENISVTKRYCNFENDDFPCKNSIANFEKIHKIQIYHFILNVFLSKKSNHNKKYLCRNKETSVPAYTHNDFTRRKKSH